MSYLEAVPLPIRPSSSAEEQILSHMAHAVLVLDTDRRIQYMNAAAENLFEISFRTMKEQPLSRVLSCNCETMDMPLNQAMEFNQPFTERGVEIVLISGHKITVDCSLVPMVSDEGEINFLIEIDQVDRQLRISREEQLINQHEATWDMVRGVAHEIKNPLGGIRGAAQLLSAELNNDEQREYTEVIIAETDRLRNLVDRMLGPNQLPNKQPVNIHAVLDHVCQVVRPKLPDTVQIDADFDPSIPGLLGDKDQLIQAVLNLVNNALEAMHGQGHIVMRTRVLRQFTIGNQRYPLVARIEIIDSGPGIAEEIQSRIFYPMVTNKDEGTGLGLSISQTLINHHGGLIECDSKPGETNFTIYLPIEKDLADE
ncbi:MAG: nitrogen regulation protein NR(II) [bacterium]